MIYEIVEDLVPPFVGSLPSLLPDKRQGETGYFGTGLFVFCLDEPVIQLHPDTIGLSHEFNLFYHYSELHGSCGETKRQGCELEGPVLTVEPHTFESSGFLGM